MCQLLGLAFNEPVDMRFSFRGFRKKGDENPDGWGIAWYSEKEAHVHKEPLNAMESPTAEKFIRDRNLMSKIFIAHVRWASKGSRTIVDTHPFHRQLNDRHYVFAHNGTLNNFETLDTGNFIPNGETDSEHAFCYLLNRISQQNNHNPYGHHFSDLKKWLQEINQQGYFNCLFSDGERLFCYSDKTGYNTLHYVRREAPFEKVQLEDEDFFIDLAEEKKITQKGFVVATKSLTKENWVQFKPGELAVFRNGEMEYRI